MAGQWADLSGLGEAIANRRYRKGAREIQRALEDEAKAAGTQVDYAQLESRLADLYDNSLAGMRGQTAPDGSPMYTSYANEAKRMGIAQADAEAGRMVAGGAPLSGAQQMRANARLRAGDFDTGLPLMQQGDMAYGGEQALKRGAELGPAAAPGGVDLPTMTTAATQSAARMGDLGGAIAGQSAVSQQRLQVASTLAGQLQTQLSNPDVYDPQKIAGTANALFTYMPELGGGLKVKADSEGKLWVTRGNEIVQELKADDSTLSMLTDFVTDPSTVIETQKANLIKAFEETRAERAATDKLYQETAAGMVKTFVENGSTAERANAIFNSAKAMKEGGWTTVGDAVTDPTTGTISQQVQKDGKIYRMERPDPETMAAAGPLAGATPPVAFYDTNGQSVDPNTIEGAQPAVEYMMAIDSASREGKFAEDSIRLKAGLNALQSVLFGGGAGTGVNKTTGISAADGDAVALGKRWILGLETEGGVEGKGALNREQLTNSRSGAAGVGQFTKGTWERYIKAHPEDFGGMTQQQKMDARYDNALMDKAIDWLIDENVTTMQRADVPVTPETIYLAHHFGAGRVGNILENPDEQVFSMLTKTEQAANPTYYNKTWADLINEFTERAIATGAAAAPSNALPPPLDPIRGGDRRTADANALPARLDFQAGGQMGTAAISRRPQEQQAVNAALMDPEAARTVALRRLSTDARLFNQ